MPSSTSYFIVVRNDTKIWIVVYRLRIIRNEINIYNNGKVLTGKRLVCHNIVEHHFCSLTFSLTEDNLTIDR